MILCGDEEAFLPGHSRGWPIYGQDAAYWPALSGETQLKLDFSADKGQELRNAGIVDRVLVCLSAGAGVGMLRPNTANTPSIFHFVMIKPTHYDDDGYPIQWLRSAIPSNTLACLNALGRGRQAPRGAGTGRRYPSAHLRRNQPAGSAQPDHPHDPPRRRPRADRPGRRAVEPVSARRRSGQAVSRRRAAGLHRRIPCLRLHRHAAGIAGRHQSGAGARHFVLRRRGRGTPARSGAARCLERRTGAALQLHGRPAVARGRAAAVPAAQARQPHVGIAVEHRSRARLSVSVLVLHHHQRAGPQEPHPLGRRSGTDRARELRGRHQAVLHHRRQFRPQQGLGAAVRPHDPDAATARG